MKPREFWIKENQCTGIKKAGKTELELWGGLQPNDNFIHVIEKSAYDQLLEHTHNLASSFNSSNETIEEELAAWEKFKKEQGIE